MRLLSGTKKKEKHLKGPIFVPSLSLTNQLQASLHSRDFVTKDNQRICMRQHIIFISWILKKKEK